MHQISLAIYEILGFILALPLSYAMARLARKYSKHTYKDELDNLFMAFWSGKEEDELYAWLRVKQIFQHKKAPDRMKYIQKKISELNKKELYSSTFVDGKGEIQLTIKN